VILQLGSIFSSLVSGLGSVIREVAPAAIGIGRQFLERELNRKLNRRRTQQLGAQAVQALNTPGIAVARVGGTIQPVGGRVQRSTFQPAALTTAQNPIGNIPLLPVGGGFRVSPFGPVMRFPSPTLGATFPLDPFAFKKPVQDLVRGLTKGGAVPQGPLNLNFQVGNGFTGPRFAQDEMGKTVMFVPSPRPGEGFISVQAARQLNLSAMKPWWRFNRQEGQFEKIKRRRMNPFNFRAAKRAGRRIESTLEAIKGVVTIQRKLEKGISAGGKVVKFRTGKRKKARA